MSADLLPTAAPPAVAIETLADLERVEGAIRKGLDGFLAVGNLLASVRECRAYRLRGCATFEDYCEEHLGFSLRYGQRLIQAAKTAAAAQQALGPGEAPRNEAVARALAPVAGDARALAQVKAKLQQAGRTVATATATEIEAAVRAVRGLPAKTQRSGGPLVASRAEVDQARRAGPETAGPAQPSPSERERAYQQAGQIRGGRPAPKPEPAKGRRAAPKPGERPADMCPWCGEIPDKYERYNDGTWHCDACGDEVTVRVAAPEGVGICADCGAAVVAGLRSCPNCGVVRGEVSDAHA